jgi:hypothetical protein
MTTLSSLGRRGSRSDSFLRDEWSRAGFNLATVAILDGASRDRSRPRVLAGEGGAGGDEVGALRYFLRDE